MLTLLGVAAAEGLYVTGKLLANRLAAAPAGNDKIDNDDGSDSERVSKPDEEKRPIDPETLKTSPELYPPLPIEEKSTHTSTSSQQSALSSIQAWEQSTLSRIQRARQSRLDAGKAVEAWEQATMCRFRRERERRMAMQRQQAVDAVSA